ISVLNSFRYASAGFADEASSSDRDILQMLARKYQRIEQDAIDAIVAESSAAPRLVTIGESVLRWAEAASGSIGAGDVRREFSLAAEPYYRALWQTRSLDEKVVLLHLAEEGVINPRSKPVAMQLVHAGLIVRDPNLRIMNETFRRFILRAAT